MEALHKIRKASDLYICVDGQFFQRICIWKTRSYENDIYC